MIRSSASLFVVALSAALAACSAASTDAPASSASAIESSSSTDVRRYEGAFQVKGRSYGLALTITQPARSVSYEHIRSSEFHLDSLGVCDAYVESPKVQVRLVVSDAYGEIVADDTEETWANSGKDLDRSVACPDGFLVHPAVVPALDTEIFRNGLGLELNGERVQLPLGYGSPGRVFVQGTASFDAQASLTFSHSKDGGYNQTKAEVARGLLTIALPAEVTLNVGVGVGTFGMAAETVQVTLRAR